MCPTPSGEQTVKEWAEERGITTPALEAIFLERIEQLSRREARRPVPLLVLPTEDQGTRVIADMRAEGLI